MRTKYQDSETVELLAKTLWMEENKDLTLFTMTQWSLEQYSLDKRLPGVRLKIMSDNITKHVKDVI